MDKRREGGALVFAGSSPKTVKNEGSMPRRQMDEVKCCGKGD